ncbi:putative permease [Pseudorhodobacter sp. 4114]|nr:putative permease [Pseudorhodobacter sp. 4114]
MQGKGLADAAIDGLNASCANTGFMGFPLILTVMGSSGLAPTLIASVLTVCVLCAIGLILIEFSMTSRAPQSGGHLQVLRRVALALVTNPILVAPLVGCLFLFLGVELPEPVDGFFTMLGAAASPCALIALGLFFAEKPVPRPSGQSWLVPALVSAKLLVHPAATWVVAGPLLGLPPPLLHTAVLLAALPTGTTPFMLTEVYHREAAITGKVVITSTIVAVFTLSGWLLLLAG